MKESYRKPLIFFENFSLAQTIARNCGDTHSGSLGESTHYNENTCTWDIEGFTLFFGHCDEPVELDDDGNWEMEGLCYNNPDGGQTVFSST